MRVKIILIIGFFITAVCAAWVGYIYPHYYTMQLTDEIVWKRSLFDVCETEVVNIKTGEVLLGSENYISAWAQGYDLIFLGLESNAGTLDIKNDDPYFDGFIIKCIVYNMETKKIDNESWFLEEYKKEMCKNYKIRNTVDVNSTEEIVTDIDAFRIDNFNPWIANQLLERINMAFPIDYKSE